MSLKNPLTAAGIEPANFRFVAQHLKSGRYLKLYCKTKELVNFHSEM